MGRTHWGDPADPPGQWQERYSKAAGPSPARLHRGPWQTSPGAMEATGDRRAGTQSRRGSPAKRSGLATQATRVRRSYGRQAGAIPLVVRDTPHGWAAPRAAAKKGGHVALLMDTCGDTLPPGTHGRGAATMPSQAHAGAAQEAPNIGQWEGQDVPLVRPSSCIVKNRHPELPKIPTYLYPTALEKHFFLLGPPNLWWCVAIWSPYLMVVCGNLVPLTYPGTWQFGPPYLWWCVATWTP